MEKNFEEILEMQEKVRNIQENYNKKLDEYQSFLNKYNGFLIEAKEQAEVLADIEKKDIKIARKKVLESQEVKENLENLDEKEKIFNNELSLLESKYITIKNKYLETIQNNEDLKHLV